MKDLHNGRTRITGELLSSGEKRGVRNKSTDQKRAELYLAFVTRGEVVTAINIAGIEPEVVVAVRQVVLGVDVV